MLNVRRYELARCVLHPLLYLQLHYQRACLLRLVRDRHMSYISCLVPLHTLSQNVEICFREIPTVELIFWGVLSSNEYSVCSHTPTTIVVMHVERGYKVRCLRCGAVGPVERTPSKAWAELVESRDYALKSKAQRTLLAEDSASKTTSSALVYVSIPEHSPTKPGLQCGCPHPS